MKLTARQIDTLLQQGMMTDHCAGMLLQQYAFRLNQQTDIYNTGKRRYSGINNRY